MDPNYTHNNYLKEFRLSIVSGEWNSLSGHPCLVYELLLDDLLLVHNKKIHFECLQVLGLQKVLIKQETFDRIISTCTLLTTVWLEDCKGLKIIKLEKELYKHLKHFAFTGGSVDIIEVHDVPTLETINISSSKIRFHGRHEFSNLKSLTLKSSEFPIRICELCIDAPNILYFECHGIVIPSISYAPNCRRSSLHLSLWCGYDVLSWFLKISELLQALRHSEISLNIFQHHMNIFSFQQDVLVREIINNGGNKPVVVEHLRWCIEYFATFPKLLNVFFTICRPRNIAQRRRGSLREERAEKEIRDYLCSLLMRREDLEDLSIQRLDKYGQWRPVQGANLLESAQSQPLNFNRIRSQLKWRILDN